VWYLIGYHKRMQAGPTLRRVRRQAGLTLRALAARAGTSHSTLAAYEAGRKVPTVETLDRVVRAAGYSLGVELVPNVAGPDPEARGRELVEVLELAALFPARPARELEFPRFGVAVPVPA
jgi:transcriptional regulator with XRE-family HTH domain